MAIRNQVSEMLDGYITCACWSSTDDNDRPLDSVEADMAPETVKAMEEDCRKFIEANLADLESAGAMPEQWGHDLWLTRNGHGAGFWDREDDMYTEEARDRLTEAAEKMGERNLYVGDDNLIYQS